MIKKNIIILSFARTGSNYISSLIANNNKERIKFISEPFHPKGCLDLSPQDAVKLGNKYKLEINDCRDLNLVKEIHKKPTSLINKVHRHFMKNEEYFLFKIFPSHLKIRQIKAILDSSFNKIFLLKRKPIDMFISLCKAQKLKQFSQVNTTDIEIEIDSNKFLNYHIKLKKQFQTYKKLSLKHTDQINLIDYDEFAGFTEDETYHILKNKLCSAGINLNPDFNNSSQFFKQDKEFCYSSKVLNWKSFFNDLTKKNSLSKLNSF